jgi:hypothetical protein
MTAISAARSPHLCQLHQQVEAFLRRLGHAAIKMTADRYSHLFPRQDDGAELAAAESALLGTNTT